MDFDFLMIFTFVGSVKVHILEGKTLYRKLSFTVALHLPCLAFAYDEYLTRCR